MPGRRLWVAGFVVLFLGSWPAMLSARDTRSTSRGRRPWGTRGPSAPAPTIPAPFSSIPPGFSSSRGSRRSWGPPPFSSRDPDLNRTSPATISGRRTTWPGPPPSISPRRSATTGPGGWASPLPSASRPSGGPSFEGRYISREANLAVVNVNANAARRLGKSWSVALGIDYAKADIRELSRNISWDGTLLEGSPDGFTKLTGDGDDIGWNVAARWASEKRLAVGRLLPLRDEAGDQRGREVREHSRLPWPRVFPDGPASAVLPLPATFATGVGYVSKGKWEGEFDIVWTGWSAFDHLRIDVKNNTLLLDGRGPDGGLEGHLLLPGRLHLPRHRRAPGPPRLLLRPEPHRGQARQAAPPRCRPLLGPGRIRLRRQERLHVRLRLPGPVLR